MTGCRCSVCGALWAVVIAAAEMTANAEVTATPGLPEFAGPLQSNASINVSESTAIAANRSAASEIQEALDALESQGAAGQVVIVFAFSLWVFFAMPVTPVELVLGFVYGARLGFVCNLFCKFVGSCAAFLVSQRIGQRYGWKVPEVVQSKLAMLQSQPMLTIFGLRLMPLPMAIKNYGLGLCEVRLLHFAVPTFLVDIPSAALWAVTGASCKSLSEAINFQSHSRLGSFIRVLKGLILPILLGIGLLYFLIWLCRRRDSVDQRSKKMDEEAAEEACAPPQARGEPRLAPTGKRGQRVDAE